MDDTKLWGGLDLGEERVAICITDALGQVVLEQEVEAKPQTVFDIIDSVSVKRLEMVGVEAGSGSHIVRELQALGVPIAILEARKASKILALRRQKTDANDARGLADIVRLGGSTVTRVHSKSLESRNIRAKLVLRQQIIKQRVAGEQVIRSLFREHGVTLKKAACASSLRINSDAALQELVKREDVDLRSELSPLINLCESMRQYENTMNARLSAMAKDHPVCRRFLDVPSIGPIVALSFYSAIDDPSRFERTEDVASFLGLTPRIRESGKSSGRPRLSKMGNRMTRTHLAIAAEVLMTSCKKESVLRTQALAFKERLGFRKARIAIARKLAIVLLSLWKTGANFMAVPNDVSGVRRNLIR